MKIDSLVPRRTNMGNDTVTLALNGDEIKLDDFAKAVTAMSSMLSALRTSVAKKEDVYWYVESLSMGSAIATARCVGKRDTVNRLVESYAAAGQAFKKDRRTGFSQSVDREVKKLVSLINGNIHSIRFETEDIDVEIDSLGASIRTDAEPTEPVEDISVSAVQGRVETIGRHKGLRFTLYEMYSDKSISCYLVPGYEERMRETWGRLAIVEGLARRDPRTGRITTLRKVSAVEIIPETTPEDCLSVIGAYEPVVIEPPEKTLQRLRDA